MTTQVQDKERFNEFVEEIKAIIKRDVESQTMVNFDIEPQLTIIVHDDEHGYRYVNKTVSPIPFIFTLQLVSTLSNIDNSPHRRIGFSLVMFDKEKKVVRVQFGYGTSKEDCDQFEAKFKIESDETTVGEGGVMNCKYHVTEIIEL